MPLLLTLVAGDVADVLVDVGKCNSIGNGRTPEAVLLLPVVGD